VGELALAHPAHVLAAEPVAAVGGSVETADDVHQRRLARAGWTHHRHELTLLDGEADGVEGTNGGGTDAVHLGDRFEAQDLGHLGSAADDGAPAAAGTTAASTTTTTPTTKETAAAGRGGGHGAGHAGDDELVSLTQARENLGAQRVRGADRDRSRLRLTADQDLDGARPAAAVHRAGGYGEDLDHLIDDDVDRGRRAGAERGVAAAEGDGDREAGDPGGDRRLLRHPGHLAGDGLGGPGGDHPGALPDSDLTNLGIAHRTGHLEGARGQDDHRVRAAGRGAAAGGAAGRVAAPRRARCGAARARAGHRLGDRDVHLTDDSVDRGGQRRLAQGALGVVDTDLGDLDLALIHLDLLRRGSLPQRGEGLRCVLQLDLGRVHLSLGLIDALLRPHLRRRQRALRGVEGALIAGEGLLIGGDLLVVGGGRLLVLAARLALRLGVAVARLPALIALHPGAVGIEDVLVGVDRVLRGGDRVLRLGDRLLVDRLGVAEAGPGVLQLNLGAADLGLGRGEGLRRRPGLVEREPGLGGLQGGLRLSEGALQAGGVQRGQGLPGLDRLTRLHTDGLNPT